jgi:hypothetical protein
MRRVEHHGNNIIVLVMAALMYIAAIVWAATSEDKWLGPCIDGPKQEWVQRRQHNEHSRDDGHVDGYGNQCNQHR